MKLALPPPLAPMLAKRVDDIPDSGDLIFEPKWDGFRTLIFRAGDEILIQSRDQKSLNRYFPDLLEPICRHLPSQCVLDGEIVIAKQAGLDFDELQMRIHPAASRVNLLAKQSPASIVFFDLLCMGERELLNEPFETRRRMLEDFFPAALPPLYLTPATRNRSEARDWFTRFEGAGLDGVMAKLAQGAYEPDKRVMLKIKHERDCDCVVAGFRRHRKLGGVGSLLLGLYDDARILQHVGVCSSFSAAKRMELERFLEPLRKNASEHHPWKNLKLSNDSSERRLPGGESRWSRGKDLAWEPLRPEWVIEVAYDHMQGSRFRHVAQFRRWRTDKAPSDCTYKQLEVVPPHELRQIFGLSGLAL